MARVNQGESGGPVMADRRVIVCPVDFSEPSRTALNYAAVIADHFGARLLVVAIDDPLLASAAENAGLPTLAHETKEELQRFVARTVPEGSARAATVEFRVGVGKPAPEILRIAHGAAAALIVMSSHGRSGMSKHFFGSTTERVLRETTIPILVTPKDAQRVATVADISHRVHSVVAPVDLSASSAHQVRIASEIAATLHVPLLLAHVLEPVFIPPRVRAAIPGADQARRGDVEAQLLNLAESSGIRESVEALVLSGDPSEEIVRLTDARGASLVVMGLHSSVMLGQRMGAVTYRVLCLTRALVLALPPDTQR